MSRKTLNSPSFHCHPLSLDTASTPESFVQKELKLGTGTLTATDHGSVAGCRKVYDLAKENNLIPILGIEAYLRSDEHDPIWEAKGIQKNKNGSYVDYMKYMHLTMHALDQVAYEAIIKQTSIADLKAEKHGSEKKPIFNWKVLEELGGYNITVGSSCLVGVVQRHLKDYGDAESATKFYEKIRGTFKPGNFYVEVFPHVCDTYWVNGVFIHINEGDKVTKLKYHEGKKLKTNLGEIDALTLVKEFNKKDNKHEVLCSVKDRTKWVDREPSRILKVEKVEAFLENECSTYSPDGDYQKGCNQFVLDLANKYGDPIIVSDDSHYAEAEYKDIQDIKLMASGGKWRFSGRYHRLSGDESFDYFKHKMGIDLKTFEKWVDNSYEWANRFKDFKLEYKPSIPKSFYPKDTLEHLQSLINKHGRMDWKNPQYVERLKREIDLFYNNKVMDFLPYFFVIEEVCSMYNDRKLLTGPTRGSAGGVLISYLLGITHLDPIRHDLSLERFLTLDRIKSGKMPDIDLDLPDRDILVDPESGWLVNEFGDHCAQISTETTLKLRSSIKDVARVKYGKVPDDIEELTKRLQNAPQGIKDVDFVFGYDNGEESEIGSIETDKALIEYVKKYPEDWKLVQMALGIVRGKGRHACSMVIADRPLNEFIPITTVSDVKCTAYSPTSVEAVGGIKFDFLGLNSLNDISYAIQLIQERNGITIPEEIELNGKKVPATRILPHNNKFYDIWDLPEKQDVFEDIVKGKTETVFQLNTDSATKWLSYFNFKKSDGKWSINSVADIAIFTALDRPGPLDAYVKGPDGKEHNMLVEYTRRLKGEIRASGAEALDGLVTETQDLLIYQESIQKIYQHFTDCSLSEAEEFRYNVGKKKKEKIIKAYDLFMQRASNKVGKEKAQQVWSCIQTFAAYGFNKSHSFGYGVIAYACAYIKHYFPLEWWCAVLRNAKKDEISEKFWKYCYEYVLLPDIKNSKEQFEIEGDKIRAPLNVIHGVGEATHKQIIQGAPYTDLEDFCKRIFDYRKNNAKKVVKTNKKGQQVETEKLGDTAIKRNVIYTLIVSGCMDSLFPENFNVYDKLDLYEKTIAKIFDKKIEPIDPKYENIGRIIRYQMAKKVLPIYSINLLSILKDAKILESGDNGKLFYSKNQRESLPVISIKTINYINKIDALYTGIKVAVPAYVEDYRKFNYKNGSKEACELLLDLNGFKERFIKWGANKGLPNSLKSDIKGSIVIAILSKYDETKPFFLQDVIQIQPPLEE